MELDFTLLFTKKLYNEISTEEEQALEFALANNIQLQKEFSEFRKTFDAIQTSKLKAAPSEVSLQNILNYIHKSDTVNHA